MEFRDFKLKNDIISTLSMQGFFSPTKIQEEFIPKAMKSNDILAKSETGSGKTLAYLLPILNSLSPDGLGALIVVPTKELALQIKEVAIKFTKFLNLKVCTIFGGSDFTRQRINLKDANIVIGTTGRLLDHLKRRTIKLHKLKFLVLDEADEMLNMGFINDIKSIYKACPKHKQTFMLSATFSEKIKQLANEFLIDPVTIEMTKDNRVVENINQCYVLCKKKGKFETLVKFLKTIYKEKIIIFVNTKKMAEDVCEKLKKFDIKSEFLHGDLLLKERKAAINNFKSYNNDILIATDVASRGLDIDNVEFIINYDMPQDSDTYVHRLGRTARAGKSGLALSLINSETQLEFLRENFSKYSLTELKVKKDEKSGEIVFVKSNSKDFTFDDKRKIVQKNEKKPFDRKNLKMTDANNRKSKIFNRKNEKQTGKKSSKSKVNQNKSFWNKNKKRKSVK